MTLTPQPVGTPRQRMRHVGVDFPPHVFDKIKDIAREELLAGHTGFESLSQTVRMLVLNGIKYRDQQQAKLTAQLASSSNGDGQ